MNKKQEAQYNYFKQVKIFIDEYVKMYNIVYAPAFTEEGLTKLTFKRDKYSYTWFIHLHHLFKDGRVDFYILHQMLGFISDILVIGRCEDYE